MADGIKIGNLDISAFKVGSDDCKVYLGDTLLYPQGQPAFQGKWLATYTGGAASSAECDSTSAITSGEITLTNLNIIEIGNCTISIGDSAFYKCRSLSSCTMGSGVTNINRRGFGNCYALMKLNSATDGTLNIPSGITNIGAQAFISCYCITNIFLPNSVSDIAAQVFLHCSGLTSVTVEATTPPTLGNGAFTDTNDCPIYVPSGSVNTYKSASGWSTYASRIQAIPNS